jgi:hypothetical protein
MTEQFEDSPEQLVHAEFQSWRRANPDGYFLNCKSHLEGMLHRTLCLHPGDTEWQCTDDGFHSLTKKKKVCSVSITELECWAVDHGITHIKRCSDCAPFSSAE